MSTTIRSFVEKHKIRMTADWADSNPNMDSKDMNHFKCLLRRGPARMTIYFSQGYGIRGEPDAAGVLDCLASDAASVDNAQSFEEWARDLGYEEDSRAERTFKACESQAQKLRTFLGADLYAELLYKTDRL